MRERFNIFDIYKKYNIPEEKNRVHFLLEDTYFSFKLKESLKRKLYRYFYNKRTRFKDLNLNKILNRNEGYEGFLIIIDEGKHIYLYNTFIIFRKTNILDVYIDNEFYFETILLNTSKKLFGNKINSLQEKQLNLEVLKVRYHKVYK